MIDYIRIGCLMATFAAMGMQLSRLIAPRCDRPWLEYIATSYLLGLGVVSGVSFLLSLAGVGLTIGTVAAALLVTALLMECAIRFIRRQASTDTMDTTDTIVLERNEVEFGLIDGCLLAVILAATIYVVAQAFLLPLYAWDTWAIWSLKAKVLLHETVRTTTYFHDASLGYSHLNYPLLVPFVQALAWLSLGQTDQLLVVLPFVGMFAAFQTVAYYRWRLFMGQTLALAMVAGLSCVPMLLRQTPLGLTDVPLMVFHGIGIAYLLSWIVRRERGALALAVAFSACAAFTKNEGLALVAVNSAALGLLVIIGLERKRMAKGLALYALVTLLCLTPWLVFQSTVPTFDTPPLTQQNLTSLSVRIGRLPTIALEILREMVRWERWTVFWPLFAVTLFLSFRRLARRENLWCLTICVLHLSVYVVAYVVTERELIWHMKHSLDRLLLHILPAATLLMGLQLKAMLTGRNREVT